MHECALLSLMHEHSFFFLSFVWFGPAVRRVSRLSKKINLESGAWSIGDCTYTLTCGLSQPICRKQWIAGLSENLYSNIAIWMGPASIINPRPAWCLSCVYALWHGDHLVNNPLEFVIHFFFTFGRDAVKYFSRFISSAVSGRKKWSLSLSLVFLHLHLSGKWLIVLRCWINQKYSYRRLLCCNNAQTCLMTKMDNTKHAQDNYETSRNKEQRHSTVTEAAEKKNGKREINDLHSPIKAALP